MPMIVGDADANTGMAGAIFAQLKTLPFSGPTALPGSPMALFANHLAGAIVAYIQANAIATGVTAGAGVSGPIT
jgi:hypothetical protein